MGRKAWGTSCPLEGGRGGMERQEGHRGSSHGPGTTAGSHLVDGDGEQRLLPRVRVLRAPVAEEVRAFQNSVDPLPVLQFTSLLQKSQGFREAHTTPT